MDCLLILPGPEAGLPSARLLQSWGFQVSEAVAWDGDGSDQGQAGERDADNGPVDE